MVLKTYFTITCIIVDLNMIYVLDCINDILFIRPLEIVGTIVFLSNSTSKG
jgi:hypothetical protein